MPFKKILVALDGSKYSQIAAEYGFWLSSGLDASLAGQHVLDPRMIDLFIAPEFAEALGFGRSVDTSEKVFAAMRRIGKVILELFATEAIARGIKTTTFLAEGYIVEEILKNANDFDLTILGHRGHGEKQLPSELLLGSVAEKLASACSTPVLVTAQKISEIKQILVAYDGSEPARGALLMAEALAKSTNSKLKAITVASSPKYTNDAQLIVEQGHGYLRDEWKEEVFCIKEGAIAPTILNYAHSTDSLLVVGAYGFNNPDDNVLGSTTSNIIRHTQSTVLIYKPTSKLSRRNESERLHELSA